MQSFQKDQTVHVFSVCSNNAAGESGQGHQYLWHLQSILCAVFTYGGVMWNFYHF